MNPNSIVANFQSNALLFALYEDPEEIQQACAQAARNRLAVNGWVFFEVFRDGRDGIKTQYIVDKMTMAFCNATGKPIGCGVAFHAWGDFNAGCFVRADFRRQKVGSRLINTLLHLDNRPCRIHDGVVGSKSFWEIMGANEFGYIAETSAPKRVY